MEYLKVHQLNIMLFMSGILTVLSWISAALSMKRRQIRETVPVLPDNTCFAYLAVTGENCIIRDVRITEGRA